MAKMGIRMESIALVIQANGKSPSYVLNDDGTVSFAYKLARDYNLAKPCLVKLVKASGANKPIVFCASWVAATDFNGQLLPILGYSIDKANTWRPVNTNFIAAYGWINFRSIDASPIKSRKPITLWLLIASVDSVSMD